MPQSLNEEVAERFRKLLFAAINTFFLDIYRQAKRTVAAENERLASRGGEVSYKEFIKTNSSVAIYDINDEALTEYNGKKIFEDVMKERRIKYAINYEDNNAKIYIHPENRDLFKDGMDEFYKRYEKHLNERTVSPEEKDRLLKDKGGEVTFEVLSKSPTVDISGIDYNLAVPDQEFKPIFNEIMRKYGVQYAIHKVDIDSDLCSIAVMAKDQNAFNHAFTEYANVYTDYLKKKGLTEKNISDIVYDDKLFSDLEHLFNHEKDGQKRMDSLFISESAKDLYEKLNEHLSEKELNHLKDQVASYMKGSKQLGKSPDIEFSLKDGINEYINKFESAKQTSKSSRETRDQSMRREDIDLGDSHDR